jgi:hypothetical protein
MCKQCDTSDCCPGCWSCQCNYSCFKCREANKISCMEGSTRIAPWNWNDLRKKFVCFDCRHIWKSNWSKYMWDNLDYRNWIDEQFKKESKGEIVKKPSCCKCGKEGIEVGRNFRHCRNEKEWIKLIDKYNKKEIDMIKDFYYYPRETLQSAPTDFTHDIFRIRTVN